MNEPDIKFIKKNETFISLDCSESIKKEISEKFCFIAPTAKFSPAFKNKKWDGKIRKYKILKNELPYGLKDRVIEYCLDNDYTYDDTSLEIKAPKSFVDKHIDNWLLKLPSHINGNVFEKRDYQVTAIKEILLKQKLNIKSPTSSGKSFIMFGAIDNIKGKKLIIVPTSTLVQQLSDDFKDYGYKGKIIESYYESDNKNLNEEADVYISTWQSLQYMKPSYFHQFRAVFGDEAHTQKAAVASSLIENCINAVYKVGTSGTYPSDMLGETTLVGLFGEIHETITLKEMIDKEYCADVTIYVILIKYGKKTQKDYKQMVKDLKIEISENEDFKDAPSSLATKLFSKELDFLSSHPMRTNLIGKFISKSEGNNLILFKRRNQGSLLKDSLEKYNIQNVLYVDGTVNTKKRSSYRAIMEKDDGINLLATYQTTGTGISVKRIHNLYNTSSTKSEFLVPQILGRGLRKASDKSHLNAFDFCDNINDNNYCWKHAQERISMYMELGLNVVIKEFEFE